MKKRLLARVSGLIAVVVLFGFTPGSAPVSAQDAPKATPTPRDIEAIYRAAYDALNAGDNEGNLRYYADDVISVALPPPPGLDAIVVGKEALRAWNADAIASHSHIEFTDFHVNGDTITCRTIVTADLTELGVGYLEFSGTAIVRDGLVVVETFLMDKESQERLEVAIALQTNKEIVGRVYDELFNQGNLAVADEIFDPEATVSFTGHKGVAAVKEDITFFRTIYPDLKIEYTDIVAEGDIVVVNIAGSGTYAGGLEDAGMPKSAIGKKITWQGTDYTRVVNGKIVAVWGTHDDGPWFEQFGLKLVPAEE